MAIFCTIYYVCSYIQRVPQAIKLLKTKSSNDYSLWQVFLSIFGLICWSIYIFTSKQAMIVYIGTVIDLVLELFVVVLIVIYYDFKQKVKIENKLKKD